MAYIGWVVWVGWAVFISSLEGGFWEKVMIIIFTTLIVYEVFNPGSTGIRHYVIYKRKH